jgi:hypothetical protein
LPIPIDPTIADGARNSVYVAGAKLTPVVKLKSVKSRVPMLSEPVVSVTMSLPVPLVVGVFSSNLSAPVPLVMPDRLSVPDPRLNVSFPNDAPGDKLPPAPIETPAPAAVVIVPVPANVPPPDTV